MEFEAIKRKGVVEMSSIEGEAGLVAGRSQREKKRSYKDLLREEEEIAAQDSELVVMGGDVHKKKKKHLSDDYHRRDHHGAGPHKKKRKSSECSPSRLSSCSSQPAHSTDTAMGLLQAITSPMATGSEPGPNIHKKPSYPPHSVHSSSKDRKCEGSTKGSHSFSHTSSHSRHINSSSVSKKHSSSSKSSLFHAGAGRGEPLTLRDGEGLKMKLILSPKERNEGGEAIEGFPFPTHPSSGSMGHHSSSGSKKSGIKKEKEKNRMTIPKPIKKKQHSREALPMVGKEVVVEGQYGGSLPQRGDCSSSGGELEAGELIIDDSYTHISSKKKKKSKKSKKKKDKEKDKDREKSSKEKKHIKGGNAEKKGFKGEFPRIQSHSHNSSNHSTSVGTYAMVPTATSHPRHHQHHHLGVDQMMVKKKKKEEKEKDKHDKDKKKKKITTAYQVFCKEYRANINAEQPGLVFGELSKKLAEVWKNLPEKEKQIWKQKAQYLQHKQIKAEATTVKQKTSSSDNKIKTSGKVVGIGAAMSPPSRSSLNIRVPEVDPIDAAAHLQLLGESLSLIGHRLQETEGMVAVSGSLSVLLDSILCALGPLTCLTAQVPQLNGCPRRILSSTLDNIAYIMPGL